MRCDGGYCRRTESYSLIRKVAYKQLIVFSDLIGRWKADTSRFWKRDCKGEEKTQ